MGIVKIRHQGALNKSRGRLVQEERLLIKGEIDDDVDDSDPAEVGCELVIVGDQTCNIPYDLYDLTSLKDVLSLETWNSCLTEEERFYLSAYLPDMDQETFSLTLKELLNGDNLLFGSPLENFFCSLQGGFYSFQVAPIREGLRFLQKREHCHSLRLYHESMNEKFEDMRKAWSNCLPSTTIEERVRIWNNRKIQKPVLLVDLNAIPTDEETLKAEEFPLLKKTKYMGDGLNLHTHAIDLNSVAMNTKPKGKGVLRIRAMETNSTSNQRIRNLPSASRETCKRVPKGVLKIKPKADPFGPNQIANSLSGIHENKISPPVSASNWNEETDSDEDTNRVSEQPEPSNDWGKEEFLKMGIGSVNDSHGYPRRVKAMLSNRLQDASSLQQSRVLCASSSNSDIFCSRKPTPTVSGENARMSSFQRYSEHSENKHKDQTDGKLSTTSDSTVVSGVEREIIFPITYKRKKPFREFNPTQSLKQPAVVANLESIVSNNDEGNLIGKAKTVKIKLKGWNNHKAQNKQGFLNRLQHGSP
ncbi:uncharacterized protein LOC109840130 [Asparagus officinalis]|uniref:uncharacterized protein LOC109840130 n=1 Tax=Asparagus officinalis TaxID=4686 RepID=UPI00098E0CF8|nr:uncharacterized protein LOC109840130 [Asparagus officinalis]